MLVKVTGRVPTAVTVTVCGDEVSPTGSEPNDSELGAKDSPCVMPNPESDADCIELLSVTCNWPFRCPEVVGVNVTLTLHDAAGIKTDGQLLVWAKSPVVTMLLIVRFEVPPFDNVIVCGELVVFTTWVEKSRLGGLKVMVEPIPVPLRL